MARTTPLAAAQIAATQVVAVTGPALFQLTTDAGAQVPRNVHIGVLRVDSGTNPEPVGYLSMAKDNGTFYWPGPAMNLTLQRPDISAYGVNVGVDVDM